MRCHPPKYAAIVLCLAAALSGCASQQPLYLRNNGDLSRYIGVSETIDNPDICEPAFSELEGTVRPFCVGGPAPTEIWELSLEKVIRISLENARVMRQIGGQVQGPPTFLTSNPTAPTIYDPAITETDARFGINAGLSLFDPTLTTNLFWERNHEPRNANGALNLPTELSQDLAEFDTTLSKTTADGTVLSLSSSLAYDLERNNPDVNPDLLHDYTTTFQMEIRKPLLQGGGLEFNRIAGPGAIPGFNQGVLIARVNSDIALASFEAQVRNLVSDVETMYWELYYDYRNLDAAKQGRDTALQTWQRVYSLFRVGAVGGDAATEAQAREQYFLFRSTAEQAQGQVYQAESKLRYLMGIAATDGRLICPVDDPTTAKISFDWAQVQSEAMARSVEIREQRWKVKQRDLELIAARNYLLPRVDLDARYSWQGMGDKIVDPGNSSITGGAFDNLGSGQFQAWHVGVEGQIPLGFRKQRDGVTNAEYAVARERARLQETELEVSHQVAFAIRDLETNRVLMATNFNRMQAAQRNVDAVKAAYDNGQIPINVLLDAQQKLVQAETEYYRAVTNYAKSISQVHFRKGSLLEYNGVYLTEGPWPAKAYFDARRRAHARAAALYMDYGFTYPRDFSKGPYRQFSGDDMAAEETPAAIAAPETPGTEPQVVPPPPVRPSGTDAAPQPAAPARPQEPINPDNTAQSPPPLIHATHDLGMLNLSPLAPRGNSTGGSDTAVRPAGYIGQ
jgi:outer membrane protein TolC